MKKIIAIALFASSLFSADVLPSVNIDTTIIRIINNLQPNQGAFLPAFKCVDRNNGAGFAAFASFATAGPGTRDYCNKWVYAPSRARALYCGSNHGAPHKFNDVWEYDLASNTWIMLHKPDSGVVPCHTWWGLTYDRKRDELLWASGGGCGSWIDWHVYKPFQPESGWTVKTFSNTAPGIGLGGAFEYIPDQDKLIWYFNDWASPGMRSLDPVTGTWSTLIAGSLLYGSCPTCKTSPAYEQVMTYDTAHKILVAGRNSNVYDYNFTRNTWQITAVDSAAALHDANGSLVYAPDVGLHFWYGSGIPSRIYGYNALTHQFTKLQPTGDAVSGVGMAYYDEKYKVMVVYVNRTVSNKIWVYRPPVSLPSTSCEKGNVNTSEITFKASSIRGGFQTEVFLPKAENYTLALYNVSGKMVDPLYSGSGNKGLIKNSWTSTSAAGGMYIVRLTVSGRTFSQKVYTVK